MKLKKTLLYIMLLSAFIFSSSFSDGLIIKEKSNQDTDVHVFFPDYYYDSYKNQQLTILYPRSTIPAILTVNQSLIIQFQAQSFNAVTATIETAYDPLPDTIPLHIDSIEQNDETYYAYTTIPLQTPEELYNLTLTIESEGQAFSQTRPRAVSIKQKIDGNFSFVQIADFHIGDPRGLKENPREIIGWKASRKIISEINLLNPDFVIISGDLTFGQLYPFEYFYEYKKCYEIIQEFQVPTFLCPGNHDGYIQTGQDGYKFWESYFGPLYYSFDYGDYHFISINSYDWPKIARIGFPFLVFNWGGSIQTEQFHWVQQDLEDHEDMSICLNLHHNPIWETTSDSLLKNPYHNRKELLNEINKYNVTAVFAGHVHYDNVTIQNNTLFITTTTASSGIEQNGYWGYRQIHVKNNTISSYNYKEPKYSIPSYHINYSYTTDKSIVIENDLDQEISVFIEFITPFDYYTVKNAQIVQIRQKGEMAAYYVTATIDKQTEKTIMLL